MLKRPTKWCRSPMEGFGVKISIPDTYPTTVSSFDTVGAAEA
jgi:hypothetical protein